MGVGRVRSLDGGHNARAVVAAEPTLRYKRAKVRKGIHGRKRLVVVVARKREVQSRAGRATRCKSNAILYEIYGTRLCRCMVRGVCAHHNHVACHSRTPCSLGVIQELDLVERATVRIRDHNGFVLGKVGRCHGKPLGWRCNVYYNVSERV